MSLWWWLALGVCLVLAFCPIWLPLLLYKLGKWPPK
jgi:hypothetical protein